MVVARGGLEPVLPSQKVTEDKACVGRLSAPRLAMRKTHNGNKNLVPTDARDLSHASAPELYQEDRGAGARVTASHSLSNTPERVISSLIETNES